MVLMRKWEELGDWGGGGGGGGVREKATNKRRNLTWQEQSYFFTSLHLKNIINSIQTHVWW